MPKINAENVQLFDHIYWNAEYLYVSDCDRYAEKIEFTLINDDTLGVTYVTFPNKWKVLVKRGKRTGDTLPQQTEERGS